MERNGVSSVATEEDLGDGMHDWTRVLIHSRATAARHQLTRGAPLRCESDLPDLRMPVLQGEKGSRWPLATVQNSTAQTHTPKRAPPAPGQHYWGRIGGGIGRGWEPQWAGRTAPLPWR